MVGYSETIEVYDIEVGKPSINLNTKKMIIFLPVQTLEITHRKIIQCLN